MCDALYTCELWPKKLLLLYPDLSIVSEDQTQTVGVCQGKRELYIGPELIRVPGLEKKYWIRNGILLLIIH